MTLADAETCLAWPTQESIAELSGLADERQVRSALASLAGTGAIEKKKVSELSEESAGRLGLKRKSRGVAYKLKLFWACEILELSMATQQAGARLDWHPATKKGKRTNTDELRDSQSGLTQAPGRKRTDADRSRTGLGRSA